MNHLTPDELIDAMEGMLEAARQQHLGTCEQCRRELADLASVMREAQAVNVPEPSPLFWRHFSERVRTAVDAEALPSGGWRAGAPGAAAALGWGWPVLVPLGAMALVAIAFAVSVPRQIGPPAALAVNDAATGDLALAGDSWVLVTDLVGDMDWDTASAAGVVVKPGDAELALVELSPEEQQELTRLLRAELQRAKS